MRLPATLTSIFDTIDTFIQKSQNDFFPVGKYFFDLNDGQTDHMPFCP